MKLSKYSFHTPGHCEPQREGVGPRSMSKRESEHDPQILPLLPSKYVTSKMFTPSAEVGEGLEQLRLTGPHPPLLALFPIRVLTLQRGRVVLKCPGNPSGIPPKCAADCQTQKLLLSLKLAVKSKAPTPAG